MADSSAKEHSIDTRFAIALIFCGALFRIISYFISNNSGGDAAERVALTAHWMQHPTLKLIFLAYPAGRFWLMAAFASLIPNTETAARLLSLVCGIGSLFVLWKLARILYGDRSALFSLAVFAFYSLHIGYSTTSSSEVSYLFFLLTSLMFFFSYFDRESNGTWLLAASGIALSITESIRFEAWTIFGGLILIFPVLWIWGRDQPAPLRSSAGPFIIFCITGGMWPVVMMTYCWRRFGDPMYLMTSTRIVMARVLQTTGNSRFYEIALIPAVLIITLSPLASGAAIYGIIKSRCRPLATAFAALTLFFLAVQNYEILRNGFLAVARYSLTPGTMLCVISGFGLEKLCQKLRPDRVRLAQAAVITFLLLNLAGTWR